jgi:hypothetical protein
VGPLFSTFALLVMAGSLFVPAFAVALAMVRSVRRAFVLSATFSTGALAGGLGALALGIAMIARRHSSEVTEMLVMTFAAAGAAAGGTIAVYLLGRLSRHPPWRRY